LPYNGGIPLRLGHISVSSNANDVVIPFFLLIFEIFIICFQKISDFISEGISIAPPAYNVQ
ncbi:MAG TPA: hypothetical protein PLD39_08465, partial [Flexilinea sp.]|nr:hypothetical protein [Flexilinea sp.]